VKLLRMLAAISLLWVSVGLIAGIIMWNSPDESRISIFSEDVLASIIVLGIGWIGSAAIYCSICLFRGKNPLDRLK
jgi:anaerobic C4-dicarboxylate transporter